MIVQSKVVIVLRPLLFVHCSMLKQHERMFIRAINFITLFLGYLLVNSSNGISFADRIRMPFSKI